MSQWVRPDEHRIVKFFPSSPPRRGEYVLVDGVRHRVLRVKVRWQGRRWTIYGKGIKVALAEHRSRAAPHAEHDGADLPAAPPLAEHRTVTLRPCLACGRPTRGTRCTDHAIDYGYATVHWQLIRGARLALDQFRCQFQHDGCTERATTVHLDPSLHGDHTRASLELTVSACARCHGVEDGRRASYDEPTQGARKISAPIASPNDPARSNFPRMKVGS